MFKNTCILKSFSEDELKSFYKIGKQKKYKKNQIIFSKNEIGKNFFIIKEGEVEIFTDKGKKKKIIANLSKGDFFGELALLGVGIRTASAVTKTDSVLYVVSREDFQNYLSKNHKFTLKLLYVLAERLRATDEEIEDLIFNNIFKRVVKLLCKLSGKNKEINASQNHIAQYLGTSRIPVNRVLNYLAKKNIISLSREKIIINDSEKIKSIAGLEK